MVRGTEEGAPFEAVDLWGQAWRSHWRISSATLRKTLRRRRRACSVLEHVACPRRASRLVFSSFACNPLEMRGNYFTVGLFSGGACCHACNRSSYLIGYNG